MSDHHTNAAVLHCALDSECQGLLLGSTCAKRAATFQHQGIWTLAIPSEKWRLVAGNLSRGQKTQGLCKPTKARSFQVTGGPMLFDGKGTYAWAIQKNHNGIQHYPTLSGAIRIMSIWFGLLVSFSVQAQRFRYTAKRKKRAVSKLTKSGMVYGHCN